MSLIIIVHKKTKQTLQHKKKYKGHYRENINNVNRARDHYEIYITHTCMHTPTQTHTCIHTPAHTNKTKEASKSTETIDRL